jgi:cell division protein ZapE
MRLLDIYNSAIKQGDIQDDSVQRQLLISFQRVADDIKKNKRWYHFGRKMAIKGLYLVGSVGVGKTYLMDLFYHNVPEPRKKRVHFLMFMQELDQQLRELQGQADPILTIAADLAHQYRVLCLDEFIVTDLAQAMMLSELLPALVARQVVLVATSNTRLAALYRGGVNRDYFIPTIQLLQQQCEEVVVNSSVDYRIGRPPEVSAYLYPLSNVNRQLFARQFELLAGEKHTKCQELMVQNRPIRVIEANSAAVWFEFTSICAMPRCQLDYIELAARFPTICVANIPVLSDLPNNTPVVLFIQLVDVLYDRGIRLIVSAAVKATDLYDSGPLLTDFSRTLSRLEEMQSTDYLARRCVITPT